MVLPTLQSYSATKHIRTPEHLLQTKEEIEIEKKIEKAPIRLNSAQSKWASPISGKLSDEALRLEQEKQEKSTRLEQRRKHLSSILEAEKNKYENELISNRQSSRGSIPDIKIRGDILRSAGEKERATITNEKLYDHQITNNLDLGSFEQQKLENLQPEYWLEELNDRRLVQKEEEGEEDEENDTKYQEELSQRLDEHDRQIERQKRIGKLKIILQQQMNEIKQKEEESELLKQDEEHLLREQYKLDQYEEQRKEMEKRYIQQDSGRQLLRQHKAKLHKRAKEIQEQLEFDMKILSSIAHADEETYFDQSEQRNAINMFKQFEQQMKFEKAKEQELDTMFQEEAAKQWSRLEQEWNHEKESREKLMHEILDHRQEQIMKKLKILKQQQEEVYEKQQTLLYDMEQTRKYDLIQKQKQMKEKEEKKPLKISIVQQERTQSKLESEKQDTIERNYNEQKDLTTTTTVEPKFYGRRRVNWN